MASLAKTAWSRRWGSNPRPRPYQGRALPAVLLRLGAAPRTRTESLLLTKQLRCHCARTAWCKRRDSNPQSPEASGLQPAAFSHFALRLLGGGEGIRTPNLMLARHLRSRCATRPLVRMEGLEPSTTPSRRECATTALHSVGQSSGTRTRGCRHPMPVGCHYRTLCWSEQ